MLDAGRLLDRPISEQVIEVPKFIIDDNPTRTLVPEPQMAEQLVEVLTVISFSSLQQTMEQHVDIQVPRRGGRNTRLQGFLPGQSSTASSSSSKKRISERTVEQIVRFPVKAFKIFVQDRFRQRPRLFNLLLVQTMTLMSLVMGFFALFPTEKSAECREQVSADPSAHGPRRLMSSSGGPMSRRWR